MTSVIGYDLKVQTGALHKVWRWWVARQQAQQVAEEAAKERGANWMPEPPSAQTVFGVGVLLILAWLWWRARRGRPDEGRPIPEHAAQAVRLYTDLERTLARRGHPRPRAATPLEHARDLAEQGFAASEDVDVITLGYVRARYGGRPLGAHEIADMRSALDRVRATSS